MGSHFVGGYQLDFSPTRQFIYLFICLFVFVCLFIYYIRFKARQNPVLMNNKLKGCPKTPNKIKKGTDRKMTKRNKENGKLNWSKQNKMRQTMITQDGDEQPSWRMTKKLRPPFCKLLALGGPRLPVEKNQIKMSQISQLLIKCLCTEKCWERHQFSTSATKNKQAKAIFQSFY